MTTDPIQMAIDALEKSYPYYEGSTPSPEYEAHHKATLALRQHQQDGGWSEDWSAAPRGGSLVELMDKFGGIHLLQWSTHYSVFGLGGCWTDGLCTMGDKIDFTHWRRHTPPAPKKENDDGA